MEYLRAAVGCVMYAAIVFGFIGAVYVIGNACGWAIEKLSFRR